MDEEENDPSIEELWAQLDRCDEHAKSDIYIELNIKLNIAERYLSALAVADAALGLETKLHEGASHSHLAEALCAGAYSLWCMGEREAAIMRFQDGLTHVEFDAIHEVIPRWSTLCEWFWSAERYEEAFALKLRIQDAFRTEGNAFEVARSLEDLADWYYVVGKYAEGVTAATEAKTIFTKFRHRLNMATSESVLGACLSELGEVEAGLKATTQSWAVIQTMFGEDRSAVRNLYYLGVSEFRAGHVEAASKALVLAKGSLDSLASMSNLDLKVAVERELSEVLKVLGNEEGAIEIDRRLQDVNDFFAGL